MFSGFVGPLGSAPAELPIVDGPRRNGLGVDDRSWRWGDVNGRRRLRYDRNGPGLNACGRAHRAGAHGGKYEDCSYRTKQDNLPLHDMQRVEQKCLELLCASGASPGST